MLITCAECGKKLKVGDENTGKKVRCPGCKCLIAVADEKRARPRKGGDDAAAESTLRCPRCQSDAVKELPPNQFSRRPGYRCTQCKALMRPPGTTAFYGFATLLGIGIALLAIGMAVLLFLGDLLRGPRIGGVAGLAALGLIVAGWAARQLFLPIPLNAPPAPSRLFLWIALLLIVVVVIPATLGCAIFCFMYYLQEMM